MNQGGLLPYQAKILPALRRIQAKHGYLDHDELMRFSQQTGGENDEPFGANTSEQAPLVEAGGTHHAQPQSSALGIARHALHPRAAKRPPTGSRMTTRSAPRGLRGSPSKAPLRDSPLAPPRPASPPEPGTPGSRGAGACPDPPSFRLWPPVPKTSRRPESRHPLGATGWPSDPQHLAAKVPVEAQRGRGPLVGDPTAVQDVDAVGEREDQVEIVLHDQDRHLAP
jgi:hypothetical protein